MNILPKKRWHVRTKENIARVRRDEAQAAEEEKQRTQRAKLAEQEARTAYLRTKARAHYDGGYGQSEAPAKDVQGPSKDAQAPTKDTADIYTSKGNINFFKDAEEGRKKDGTNKEYEEEKKAEQEKYEKAVGYLTYLGQDSLEAKGAKAWYEGAAGRVRHMEERDEEELEEVGMKTKSKLDPMTEIAKYMDPKPVKKAGIANKSTSIVDVTKKIEVNKTVVTKSKIKLKSKKDINKKKRKKEKRKKSRRHYLSDDNPQRSKAGNKRKRSYSSEDSEDEGKHRKKRRRSNDSRDERSKKKHKKSKSSKKRRHRSHSSSESETSSTNTESSYEQTSEDEETQKEKKRKLEVLRAERIKRETEERRRAERLLAGLDPDKKEAPAPAAPQKYNQQFNPHLARQNQEQNPLQSGVQYWKLR